MKAYLQTLCGAEQVVELDAHAPIPHIVDVVAPSGALVRRFKATQTDRWPLILFVEVDARDLVDPHAPRVTFASPIAPPRSTNKYRRVATVEKPAKTPPPNVNVTCMDTRNTTRPTTP